MKNKKHKNIILHVILIFGLVQAIYAILQFYNLRNVLYIKIIKHRYYSTGFQINPNFFGSLMTICLSLSISLFFFKNRSKYNVCYLILSIIFFFALLTSGAMSAVVALFFLIIFLIISLINFKKNIKNILIKILVATAVLVLGYILFHHKDNSYLMSQVYKTKNEVVSIINGDVKDTYGTGRIYIWKETLKAIPNNLFTGVGIDNFYYAFGEKPLIDLKSGLVVDKAHNEYLQKLITEGIFSLIIYLTMLGIIFIKSLKILIGEKNYLFISLFLCFVSYSIQAFFNISVITVAPIYYIIMGLLVSELKGVKHEENRIKRITKNRT